MPDEMTDTKPRKPRTVEKSTYMIQMRSETAPDAWHDIGAGDGSTWKDTADALRWVKAEAEAGDLKDGDYRIVAVKREFPLKVEKQETRKVSMGESVK